MLGRTKSVWVEGEGMLHALYFKRKNDGCYTIFYNNRYVQTVTYNLEKQSTSPLFLPAVKGDSLAVLCSMLLNWVSIFCHTFKIFDLCLKDNKNIFFIMHMYGNIRYKHHTIYTRSMHVTVLLYYLTSPLNLELDYEQF